MKPAIGDPDPMPSFVCFVPFVSFVNFVSSAF